VQLPRASQREQPTFVVVSSFELNSLCPLCVLCVSVVNALCKTLTTETQRTQRGHRGKMRAGHYYPCLCFYSDERMVG
jgi:hypothetical protein